ncbi:centrosomal protein of 55 kDa [Esox lucius]|uniref:TSG101 and ALIX binding domain-containing protein n=1 Tax=Esox lucius TaxID=8010 RepID=A0A3P8XHS4_ESOLU|nr:centrosomal protein of 55 kDa [Esox lucius]XP_010893934.1 centrosomal protein of 55 kDa [Esox lucius]XP_019901767.1 centrosomal protein of 55 kDa [Esox lucius]
MTSKGTKETIVNKLGFKSSGSKQAEVEMEKLRKENAQLKKKIDEISKRSAKPPDSDKSKLLERILSLETLREKNTQQLLAREKEVETLKQQLRSSGGEVVASLQAQLDQVRREAEHREKLFQSLSEETGNLKNKLVAVSARCQTLEKQDPDLQNGRVPSAEVAVLQEHLTDALEKNQQWLVYDQQREAYVKAVLARTLEMEQQLNQANRQQHKEGNSDEKCSHQLQDKDNQQLRLQAEMNLAAQREAAARAQGELAELQKRYDERCREGVELRQQLQAERLSSRESVSQERKCSADHAARLRSELESMDARLEEERKRSAELLGQVNLLQKSLLNQNEEQRRVAVLEQQIQLSAKDFENEKLDRQSLQHQLHKVLKELRKAQDQITKLESSHQKQSRFSEPSSYNKLEFQKLSIEEPIPMSPSKHLLDESFLECPKCRALYTTSQHRELLAHLDYCFA